MVKDIVVVAAAVAAIAGCNAIVGREPGTLESAATSSEATTDKAPVTQDAPAEIPDAGGDTMPTSCDPASKLCDGRCVAKSDSFFGCGDTTCTPCNVAHARAACAGATCVAAECAPGYADCNGSRADGCETDLSDATHCGACNARCLPVAPFCVPSAAGFACGTGCTASAPTLCGNTCADLTDDPKRCGQCNHACPTPPNGKAECSAGICGVTCAAHWANCDQATANGCEVSLLSDPSNCGACGVACAVGTTCVGGACL